MDTFVKVLIGIFIGCTSGLVIGIIGIVAITIAERRRNDSRRDHVQSDISNIGRIHHGDFLWDASDGTDGERRRG